MTSIAFGQSAKTAMHCEIVLDTLTNKEIYKTVDTQAGVIGGLNKLYAELGTINIPKDTDIEQIKIFISFIVEPNGDITGLRTIGTAQSTKLDNELLQIFRKYKWEPGTCKGVKVSTRLVYKVAS
jgi:outer membrane biosynthesis protein TonB